ncbi:hypothetical protein VTK56DRAFT_5729 [Thermocarpiscus australiensis]
MSPSKNGTQPSKEDVTRGGPATALQSRACVRLFTEPRTSRAPAEYEQHRRVQAEHNIDHSIGVGTERTWICLGLGWLWACCVSARLLGRERTARAVSYYHYYYRYSFSAPLGGSLFVCGCSQNQLLPVDSPLIYTLYCTVCRTRDCWFPGPAAMLNEEMNPLWCGSQLRY